MSFSTREQIQRLIEDLLAHSWPSDSCGSAPTLPFPEMRYAEAMSRYGVDKPDTRFGNLVSSLKLNVAIRFWNLIVSCLSTLQLQDVTETVRNSEMSQLFSACQREDFAAVAIVFKQCAVNHKSHWSFWRNYFLVLPVLQFRICRNSCSKNFHSQVNSWLFFSFNFIEFHGLLCSA